MSSASGSGHSGGAGIGLNLRFLHLSSSIKSPTLSQRKGTGEARSRTLRAKGMHCLFAKNRTSKCCSRTLGRRREGYRMPFRALSENGLLIELGFRKWRNTLKISL